MTNPENQEEGIIRRRLSVSDLGQLPVEAAFIDLLKEQQPDESNQPPHMERKVEDDQA